MKKIVGICKSGTSESNCLAAAIHIIDRGWGKVTTEDHGDRAEILIKIRHLLNDED